MFDKKIKKLFQVIKFISKFIIYTLLSLYSKGMRYNKSSHQSGQNSKFKVAHKKINKIEFAGM